MKNLCSMFILTMVIIFIILISNNTCSKFNLKKLKAKTHEKIIWDTYSLVDSISNNDFNEHFIDPENLLDDNIKKKRLIAKATKLKTEHNIFPLVIFISEISKEFLRKNSGKKNTFLFLKEFTKTLMKKFSFDDENYIIILFSIHDKQANIRGGNEIRHLTRKRHIESMLNEVKNELIEEKYPEAAEKILDMLFDAYKGNSINILIIFAIIFIPLIIFILVTSCFTARSSTVRFDKTKVEKPVEKTYKYAKMSIETILTKFDEINKLQKTSSEITLEVCIICLNRSKKNEDLDENEDIDIFQTVNVDYENPLNFLQCGHYFHYDCIFYWYGNYMKECPACKWKIDSNVKITKPDEINLVDNPKYNYLNGVIEVHCLINPDLLLINLSITKIGIVYRIESVVFENEENNKHEKMKISE